MSPDDGLERQVERAQLFTHSALGQSSVHLNETRAFVHGLVDLLLEKSAFTEDELLAAIEAVRHELVERGESLGPGLVVRVDGDRQAAPAEVDCSARMHVCHAVCCKLDFALSVVEVEAGAVKFDLGRPYHIRHQADGCCSHLDRDTGSCSIYADRPGVCRTYSCANDERIWSDFDAMELNHEWIDANLTPTDGPQRRATLMDATALTAAPAAAGDDPPSDPAP